MRRDAVPRRTRFELYIGTHKLWLSFVEIQNNLTYPADNQTKADKYDWKRGRVYAAITLNAEFMRYLQLPKIYIQNAKNLIIW